MNDGSDLRGYSSLYNHRRPLISYSMSDYSYYLWPDD